MSFFRARPKEWMALRLAYLARSEFGCTIINPKFDFPPKVRYRLRLISARPCVRRGYAALEGHSVDGWRPRSAARMGEWA